MSDLFDAIVGFKVCVLTIDDKILVDEDSVEAKGEEKSSFAEWFSSFVLLANFAFAAISDMFDAIVAFKVCFFTFEVLRILDEDPVEADDEE